MAESGEAGRDMAINTPHLVEQPLDGPRLFKSLQAEPGLAALAASHANGALDGFVCVREGFSAAHGGVDVHIWLDRSIVRLPDLLAREQCADLSAAAQFLERFDPMADRWRDVELAEPSTAYAANVGRRTRKALLRERFDALVGEALAQAQQ